MQLELQSLLYDISSAIDEIEIFLRDISSFEEFQKDLKTRRAIERNIEIIGEAMSKILESKSSINITDARKIVDTRNRIIHGYSTVSSQILWNIITEHIPVLKKEINSLLRGS